jgi:NAD(P)-dependent dehydrogenase (short-subunit alcohol dehydrogenase family)
MIIVTGGTHGIGRACVSRFTKAGEQVVLTGRDAAAGEAAAKECLGATYVQGDVSSDRDCERVIERAMALGRGRIDGLVNNAGMSKRSDFRTAKLADWDVLFSVNARSAFVMTKIALPGLLAAKGSVVNVSSIAGKIGEEGLSIYCATKAALLGLTQALAVELGGEVRFNAICPGQIDTRMMAGIKSRPDAKRRLEARIPAGRFGTPEEVAEAVAWLISPAASYINGVILTVDGGETAGLLTPRDLPAAKS